LVVDASGKPTIRLPQAPCDVVINGPAFRVDPCDHPSEPWLTRDATKSGFFGSDVDNDNDGSPDGRWLSEVLPMVRRSDGRSIRCDVSILVKDLDGRINVNAHGTARRHSQTGRPYRARSEYGYLRRTVPIGMGFGPADIDASALFSTVPGFAADGSTFPARPDKWFDGRVVPVASTWDALLRGDSDPSVHSYPTPDSAPWLQRRPSPVLGGVAGRYGADAVPGTAGQDLCTQYPDEELMIAPYGVLASKANSPADLKGRIQVSMQQPAGADGKPADKGVATLLFYSPDIAPDSTDDPYEIRLGSNGARTGFSNPPGDGSADSLYTIAELERVLRQFDSDASNLPPRLAAALGPRLKEDRNEDGQLDPAEDTLWQEDGSVVTKPDDPVPPIAKRYLDDGEDRALLVPGSPPTSLPPNGILDKGEDTNPDSPGYLALSRDTNGSGFRDMPEDRNGNRSGPDRYWPKEAFNPAEPDNPFEPFPRTLWERDFTQTLRDMITTDSWDTPGLTGLAAKRIEKYLIEKPQAVGDFSPDCLGGLRFDLNRPLPNLDAQAKQDYCKHLFYVLTALGVTSSRDAAQWAANIVDFRDADSVMTAFRYDPQPDDGWGTPSEVVFGVERPELLMTEAASWVKNGTHGQVFVMLHRPWNAIARTFQNAANSIPPQASPPVLAEPIDVRLTASVTSGSVPPNSILKETDDSNGNGVAQEPALDLELQCPGATKEPVWRVVIGPGTPAQKIVRFDNPSPFPAGQFGASTNRAALRAVTAMPANAYLCVASGAPQEGISTGTTNLFTIDSGTLFVSTPGNTVIELQRLADPWGPYDQVINPHVPIDRVTVRNIDRSVDQNTLLPKQPWQMTKRAWNEPKLNAEMVTSSTTVPNPRAVLTNFWRSTRLANGTPRLIPPDPANQPDPQYPDKILPANAGGPGDLPPSLGPLDFIAPWLHWPNRPFISVGELLLVPRQAAADWLQTYTLPCTDPGPSGSAAEQSVFDACHVYTRFAGNRVTLTGSNNLALIGAGRIPFDQLSSWREPGRVNLYTGGTSPVVRALVAGRLDGRTYPPLQAPDSGDLSSVRAPTMRPTATLLTGTGAVFLDTSPEYAIKQAKVVAPPHEDDYVPFNPSQNPFFCFNTAIRMPNVATTRSHVFAVWITVRLTDAVDPSMVAYRRLFAIIDRSVPVGFIHGMDLNTRDMVLLQRYLD
jgi:hypothetical protein